MVCSSVRIEQGRAMRFKKILIAVDDSSIAAHAAEIGTDLATQLGAEVAFVHVLDTSAVTFDPNCGIPADEWLTMAKDEAKRLLKIFTARTPVTAPPFEFLEVGKPAAKIVDAATTWQADLVVMGTHSRNAIANVLLGSVAQGVLHHAPCPVMVVRAQ
jgi:nucleotide-binding universal stress UspA family protein